MSNVCLPVRIYKSVWELRKLVRLCNSSVCTGDSRSQRCVQHCINSCALDVAQCVKRLTEVAKNFLVRMRVSLSVRPRKDSYFAPCLFVLVFPDATLRMRACMCVCVLRKYMCRMIVIEICVCDFVLFRKREDKIDEWTRKWIKIVSEKMEHRNEEGEDFSLKCVNYYRCCSPQNKNK